MNRKLLDEDLGGSPPTGEHERMSCYELLDRANSKEDLTHNMLEDKDRPASVYSTAKIGVSTGILMPKLSELTQLSSRTGQTYR